MKCEIRQQAVTGLTPPSLGEARIREAWPSVAANHALASLGYRLTQTIVLAPLAWLLMSGAYFGKVLPGLGRRYLLTNRRLSILGGWRSLPVAEVALDQIDDVRIVTDGNSTFFRAATLEIVHDGKIALTLPGVPEADSFRIAILNARNAWVPGKAKTLPFIPAESK
jgi:hypothetical protein